MIKYVTLQFMQGKGINSNKMYLTLYHFIEFDIHLRKLTPNTIPFKNGAATNCQ